MGRRNCRGATLGRLARRLSGHRAFGRGGGEEVRSVDVNYKDLVNDIHVGDTVLLDPATGEETALGMDGWRPVVAPEGAERPPVVADAWIARHNIDRYETTGKVDWDYLRGLSADAVPTLAAPKSIVMKDRVAAVTVLSSIPMA